MTSSRALRGLLIALVLAIAGHGAIAQTQTFPNRLITIVVPFAPGGSDVVVRAVAAKLSESLKVPVIVENKPGAGGIVATETVKRAAPDGHTLLLGTTGSHAINSTLYKRLPYDPVADFEPVTTLMVTKHVLVVPAASSIASLADLTAAIKQKPDLTYGSPSVGTSSHLLGEIFSSQTGGKLVHVPFKGAAPALQELLAGRLDFMFDAVVISLPQIKAGKLKPLAVASKTRVSVLPDVPTTAELGVADLDLDAWFGIYVPARTPKSVIERLHAELVKAAQDPQLVATMATLGWEMVTQSPAEFGELARRDGVRLGKVVRDSGAKAD